MGTDFNNIVPNNIVVVGDYGRAKVVASLFDEARLAAGRDVHPDSSGSISPISSIASTSSLVNSANYPCDVPGVYGYRSSRGFLTYTGSYSGIPISVVAIGMGYPNMDFFVREARAITDGPINIIRIGTCGSIIRDCQIGTLAIPEQGAIMVQRNYNYPFKFSNASMTSLNNPHVEPDSLPYRFSRIYLPDKGLTKVLKACSVEKVGLTGIHLGLNGSSDSFYASQGRMNAIFSDDNEGLLDILSDMSVSTIEMETAQLFHLAACVVSPEKAINCSAIQVVVANRVVNDLLVDKKLRTDLDASAAEIALSALVAYVKEQ